jgi:hypothetical protein
VAGECAVVSRCRVAAAAGCVWCVVRDLCAKRLCVDVLVLL